jgi:tetratricopeptide (TPR) repeat protein
MGNFGDAEDGYLQALAGYEALLSSTHEDTIEVAYELAEFYARNDRMDDADKVIDWMGDKHMERWPLGHKQIRVHLIRVADKLYSWSRADDAVSILSRAANLYEKSLQPQFMENSLFQNLREHAPLQSMRDERRKPVRFGGGEPPQQEDEDNSIRADYEVILAMARAQAEEEGAEALLLSLLEQCEKQPEKLSVQILEAKGALVDLYKLLEKPEKVDEALCQIDKVFWAVFNSNAKKTKLLLEAAIDVVSLLVKAERYSEAEPLFGRIELDVVKVFGEDDEVTISTLIQIGKLYQTHKRWDDARPRFEQALAASMTAYGLNSTMTKRLEDTLEKKSYIMSIPRFEELRQLSTSRSARSHCLGHELGYGNTAMFFVALMFQHYYY